MSSSSHGSLDGIHFGIHKPFIEPKEPWDAFGCEDPRVTAIDGTYFTFYTALSGFPFGADNIKVGVALSRNFKHVSERHLVTPFNAKAMTLFPEKIRGKYWAFLTANTDLPPHEKIALASFDTIVEIWDQKKWATWYEHLEEHAFPLQRDPKTTSRSAPNPSDQGGLDRLFLYPKLPNRKTDFSIEALLLDQDDPRKIIGQTHAPLLVPRKNTKCTARSEHRLSLRRAPSRETGYPSTTGAADTTTAIASKLEETPPGLTMDYENRPKFERYRRESHPRTDTTHPWESKAVFNPAAQLCENGAVRLFYRAQSFDDTSVFGYAESRDGYKISERLPEPAYVPRAAFEEKTHPGTQAAKTPGSHDSMERSTCSIPPSTPQIHLVSR